MTLIAWICVGIAGWLAVAAILGVLIGQMIRNRDRQVPSPNHPAGHARPTNNQERPLTPTEAATWDQLEQRLRQAT